MVDKLRCWHRQTAAEKGRCARRQQPGGFTEATNFVWEWNLIWILMSSGMWRSIIWYECVDVSEKPTATINIVNFSFPMAQQPPVGPQPPVGQGLLIIEASRSHSDTPQSVGLLWTSDQPDAETSTWQHTTLTTDIHAIDGIRPSNSSKRSALDRAATRIGNRVD
jgi:hypothetical protein